MGRTRIIVLAFAILGAGGMGFLIGGMAGGSSEPAIAWNPPSPTAELTATVRSDDKTPTAIPTVQVFPTAALPQVSPPATPIS